MSRHIPGYKRREPLMNMTAEDIAYHNSAISPMEIGQALHHGCLDYPRYQEPEPAKPTADQLHLWEHAR